jgi:hypothetical protein
MDKTYPTWRSKLSSVVWPAACAEGVALVALFLTIATCAPVIHFTYFATRLGKALLWAVLIVCVASLITFLLALFAYGWRRIAGIVVALVTFLVSLGMIGVAE